MRIQVVARFDAPGEAPGSIVEPQTVLERIQCWWDARCGRLHLIGRGADGWPSYLRLHLPADAGGRLR